MNGRRCFFKESHLNRNLLARTLIHYIFAPENGWLEDDPFLLGFCLFSGAKLLLVLERVTFCFLLEKWPLGGRVNRLTATKTTFGRDCESSLLMFNATICYCY